MGETTGILWCDHTFNAWWGCAKVSAGCTNCYADSFATRVGHGGKKPAIWGVNAERKFFGDKHWSEPLAWNANAEGMGVRRRVFCSSMADVFEDRPDLVDQRARLFRLIESTTHLDWLLLTKRPENVAQLAPWNGSRGMDPRPGWPANVWLGTTTEDQQRYDERWPVLAATGATVKFISYEPALGPLVLKCNGCGHDVGAHLAPDQGGCSGWFPDWVIVGAESGARRRPFEIEWLRRVVDDCRRARIPVFVKQDSAFKSGERGRIPDDLWIHQFPRGAA